MKRIEKKTWPDMFEKVLSGEKDFDIRLGDGEYEVGDVLVLKEWDPEKNAYTGREIEKEITFILNTKDIKYWEKKDIEKFGLVVMSLKNRRVVF